MLGDRKSGFEDLNDFSIQVFFGGSVSSIADDMSIFRSSIKHGRPN